MKYHDTLLNSDWLHENEKLIKETLPDTWTHVDNFNPIHLGYRLKTLGVEWWGEEELTRIVFFLEAMKFLERKNDVLIRANPTSIRDTDYGEVYHPSILGILVLLLTGFLLYLLLR